MRKAKITDIDYNTGMASVVYLDGAEGVTDKLPTLCVGKEYSMPDVGAVVAVERTSKGRGIILGELWNKGHMPQVNGKETYHKKLNKTAEMSAKEGVIQLKDGDIEFVTDSGSVKVSEIIAHLQK